MCISRLLPRRSSSFIFHHFPRSFLLLKKVLSCIIDKNIHCVHTTKKHLMLISRSCYMKERGIILSCHAWIYLATMPSYALVTLARVASSSATAWCSGPSASSSSKLVSITQSNLPTCRCSVTMPLLLGVASASVVLHIFSCSLGVVIDIVVLIWWACLRPALVEEG